MYFTCCKIVGVKPGSDPETIKAAYRRSAKELHPDVNDSVKAHQYFIILKNAYEYLLEHPYTPEEVDYYLKYTAEERKERSRSEKARKNFRRTSRTTLREILKNSGTARFFYLFFHFFFITIGLIMLFSAFYDIFFHPRNENVDILSAYFTLISGLLFGLLFTSIFSFSIVNYFRNR